MTQYLNYVSGFPYENLTAVWSKIRLIIWPPFDILTYLCIYLICLAISSSNTLLNLDLSLSQSTVKWVNMVYNHIWLNSMSLLVRLNKRWLSPLFKGVCLALRSARQVHLLLSSLVNIEHLTAQGWPSLCWGRFYKTLHVTVLRHLCHGRNEESVGW